VEKEIIQPDPSLLKASSPKNTMGKGLLQSNSFSQEDSRTGQHGRHMIKFSFLHFCKEATTSSTPLPLLNPCRLAVGQSCLEVRERKLRSPPARGLWEYPSVLLPGSCADHWE
jgi:hypothetical protein